MDNFSKIQEYEWLRPFYSIKPTSTSGTVYRAGADRDAGAISANIGSGTSKLPTEAIPIGAARKVVDHAFARWGVAGEPHFLAACRARWRNRSGIFHAHATAPHTSDQPSVELQLSHPAALRIARLRDVMIRWVQKCARRRGPQRARRPSYEPDDFLGLPYGGEVRTGFAEILVWKAHNWK